MTVNLIRAYDNFPAGAVATFSAETEAALISQGIAVATNALPTSGPQSSILSRGTAVFAAGEKSLVITTPTCTSQSFPIAIIAQAVPDATLTQIRSCVPGSGLFTIYGDAASTGNVVINWIVFNTGGLQN